MLKGRVVLIGTFDEEGKPKNWVFEGGDYPGIQITSIPGSAFEMRLSGYTIEELREIYYKKMKEEQK